MSAATYRPGDIALVKDAWGVDSVAVWLPWLATMAWHAVDGDRQIIRDPDEVGPVLGNVTDIAAQPGHGEVSR